MKGDIRPEKVIPSLRSSVLDASKPADFEFAFDLTALSASLGNLPTDTVESLFRDGRRTSVLIEYLLIHHLGGEEAPSSNSQYDIRTPHGDAEVRCLTKSGIGFAPSWMYGSGRKFEIQGFLDKLDAIIGYFVADIRLFPEVRVSVVPSAKVRAWWDRDILTVSNGARLKAPVAREQIDQMLEEEKIKLSGG